MFGLTHKCKWELVDTDHGEFKDHIDLPNCRSAHMYWLWFCDCGKWNISAGTEYDIRLTGEIRSYKLKEKPLEYWKDYVRVKYFNRFVQFVEKQTWL